MKKQIRNIGLALFLVALAVLLFWSKDRNEGEDRIHEAPSSGASEEATDQQPLSDAFPTSPDPIQALMRTPIEFYGLVLDQHGNPVPAAKVSGSVLDNMIKGTPVSATADASGKFMIKSKGRSLRMEVSKSGYYRVNQGEDLKSSSQGFDFGVDSGRGVHQPDESSPVIFQLRKEENPVALDTLRGQSKVPRDGSPILISLSKTSKVTLQISCRTMEDATQPPNAPYDWRCEVKIEGGSILETTEEHSFVAPEGEYASADVIDMPKSLAPKEWNSRAKKTYWLRFPDNTFGKISFMMIARGDHFAQIEGFRNPSPNDRNLEPKLDDR